ncbi:MAG TPA: MFS transporter [Gaiellaceae bacterium]|nr:MFS transporter [Gaiellaceae bacterium]
MGGRLHYAWVVVGIGFVALVMSAGFRSVAGVLLVPLNDEFGWSHQTIGLAVSFNLLCFGLGAPFAAAFVERFGMRRVVSAALAAIAVSSLLTLGMTEPWQLFLLWGVVNGTATGAVSVPLAAIIANRWFVARRGLVTGVLTASNASGQLVFLPLLAWLSGFDWRYAALLVAVAALGLVLPLVVVFMRDRPRDVGERPYGAGPAWEEPPPAPAAFGAALAGLRAGLRSRTFWILAGTFFVCGATTNGLVSTHLIPAAHDHGIAQVSAAGLLALIGVFDIVGTVGSGWLTDRYDPRKLLLAYYGFRGLALLALPFAFDSRYAALIGFAVVYGLDWVATVPPTSALATATFGRQSGVVFAWIFSAHQLGAATAAWAAGVVRTATGEYTAAWLTAGGLALVAAAAVLVIAATPRRPVEAPAPA